MLALAFYDVLCCLICHFCALHSMRKLPISQAFGASIASDYISCSSSFCTFSLSTRHCSRWISCICQHLKIVWETSKTDPFSLGKIIRHTFALALAQKKKKCDHFGGSSGLLISKKFFCVNQKWRCRSKNTFNIIKKSKASIKKISKKVKF